MDEFRDELEKIKNDNVKKYLLRGFNACEYMVIPSGMLDEIVKEAHNKTLEELTNEELKYQLKIAYSISYQQIAFNKDLILIIQDASIKGDK